MPSTDKHPAGPGGDLAFRAARAVSLVAALALVAQSEWSLALAVGWPAWVAWAAPVALDAYVLAAVRARRDLGASVLVSAGSVLASHAVYAAPAVWEGTPDGGHLVWPLAAACSVVPLLVTWRVHHLEPNPDAAPETTAPTVSVRTAPVLAARSGLQSVTVRTDDEGLAGSPTRRRTLDDLRAELGREVAAGRISRDAAADTVRAHLRCGSDRARLLVGELRAVSA